uniref:RNase H type-1 domain-containing protein n=1 Tax=Cannabis sativa TaxID=3483 RepID=A0A803Q1U8_CANSA
MGLFNFGALYNGPSCSMPWPGLAPPAGSLKLNVDGAICGENSTIGLGALVRDSDDFPLGCFAKSLAGFFSFKEVEALAISYVLKWCLELGFSVSFVESDAKIIVN